MDESRFDTLIRTFATSRRRALKLALGTLAGFTGPAASASAARRGFPGPPNPFQPGTCGIDGSPCGNTAGRICCNGSCCPPNRCCSDTGQCTVCDDRCEIQGQDYAAGDPNPGHDCQICDPTQNHFDWSSAADGLLCGALPGRLCCNGACCSPSECCEGIGVCTECGPHCLIDGIEIDAGAPNPQNECEVCDPEQTIDTWSDAIEGIDCNGGDGCCSAGACGTCSCLIQGHSYPDGMPNPQDECQVCRYFGNPDDWSNKANGSSCGNSGDRDCCDGACCPAGHYCTLDGCEPCCHIGSETVADGVVNPQNSCQVCDSSHDSEDWTTLGDRQPCGATGNSECCNGDCCPAGQCCRNGACDLCDCEIGGRAIAPDTINDNNPCEICKPALNRFDWSAVASRTTCDAQGGTCCGRDCCSSDLCCLLDACGECLCSIENDIVEPQERNPQNTCQLCDPHANPFDWSTVPDRGNCGTSGDQQCCNGFCCDPGQCCLGGACRPCGCFIDGQEIGPNELNPANDCQMCLPDQATNAWSFLGEGAPCGDTGAQCCTSGVCQNCGCLIEGFPFTDGQQNPENECEQCDAALDPSNWSPQNETFSCGEAGDGICCEGVCCPAGNVCNLDGTCTPPGCIIDGVNYQDGAVRPRQRCDVCDAANDPTGWTPRFIPDCPPPCAIGGVIMRYGTVNPDNPCQICRGGDDWSPSTDLFCGDGTQVCCNGACCDVGACCSAEGTCGFDNCEQQGCVIDGVQFEDGTENPANACQICNISQSTTAWTPQFGQCGPNFDRFCCEGVCCDLGACCNNEQVCDFDSCETCAIGGVLYFPEDRNPANGCEFCHANSNKFGWTPLPDFSWCDEMQFTTCCNGSCCPPGEACQQGSCQPI